VDPRLLILAAATLWGTTGTARALGPDNASPAAVGAARLIVGGVLLLGIVALRRGPGLGGGPGRPPAAADLAGLGAAAVAMAAYQPLFFGGVARTGVAIGTVVGIGSSPVFAGILGRVVRGERPGRRWLVATALALAGTALLVGTGDRDDVDPLGIALALGAGLAYACYVLASKLVLDRGWPPDAVTARVFTTAAVLLVPVGLVAGLGPLATPGGVAVVVWLGVATVALAYVLFGRGLLGVGVATAGTLTLAEPATAAVLGVVVVGERFGGTTLAGVGLIIAGLVALAGGRSAAPTPPTGSPG